MFWYLFFATVPVIVSLVVSWRYKKSIKYDDKAKRTFLIWCGIAMFLIIALRHRDVGSVDSSQYYFNWETLSTHSWNELKSYLPETNFETGYCVFVWCVSHILPDGQFAFIISAILFTIAVCRFIYINSKDPELSFVMYICLGLYTFMAQGLRQSIAMSICLFALEFAKKRKFIPFVLLVLLSSTFHTSAIVFFVIYFIYGVTINVRTIIIGFGITGVLLALSNQLAAIGNLIFQREYEGEVESGGFVAVIIYVLILGFSIMLSGKWRRDKDYSFFVFMTWFGFVFYLMRYTEVQIAERMSWYFMFGQLIALPNAISRFEKSVSFVIKSIVIALCIMLFAYRLSGDGLVVYRFFWQ